MVAIISGIIRLTILFFLCMMMVPCTAIQPVWTYTDRQTQIGDLVVVPDGSAVVAGAGKVLLLSRNGTVLAREPYGESVAQSRDGSTVVTGYASVVSSTVYLFKMTTDATGHPFLQKQWDATLPNRVDSSAVSDNGNRIAFSVGGTGIHVYDGNTGNRIGFGDEYSSLIAMSGNGKTIVGVSTVQGMKVYNAIGDLIIRYDITLAGQPSGLLMDTNGSVVVFNAGPHILAFNVSNGADLWKRKSSSDVNMLAMTPAGDYIVAGTENGTVDFYNAEGNLSWTYFSNSGTVNDQAINAVALTRDGSRIIAGSIDGKVILLDSSGSALWKYTTVKDPIRRVAVAADGSLAVASSDTTIYAFSTGGHGKLLNEETSMKIPLPIVTPGVSLPTSPETGNRTKESTSTLQWVVPETPTITMTEYSIIRKATQSPLDATTGIAGLLLIVFFVFTKNR